jgi:hypothetical protein
MQPGTSPNQPQMMYSNQQFPMAAQGHVSGANSAAMMTAAGPAAMMQSPGMPPMMPNGQSKLLPVLPYYLLSAHPYLPSLEQLGFESLSLTSCLALPAPVRQNATVPSGEKDYDSASSESTVPGATTSQVVRPFCSTLSPGPNNNLRL